MARRGSGFNLVELTTVIAILGITLAVAAPSFSALAEHNRTLTVFHALSASLAGARMAAINLGRPVTLCPTQDGLHCRRDLVWDDGWITYIDPERTDQPSSAAAVIQHVESSQHGITVRSTVGRHRVRFQPMGWASGANISLRLCNRRAGRWLGSVIVNNAGRPRSERQNSPESPCPYDP